MLIERIPKEKFITTEWSHGKTTELFIYPHDSDYSKKQFAWRVSSATVNQTPSSFTPLFGIKRWIMPFDGGLHLTHSNRGKPLYSITLNPYETHCFRGDWHTECEGTARDFNLMLKDRVFGLLSSTKLIQDQAYELGKIFPGAFDDRLPLDDHQLTLGIFSVDGTVTVDTGHHNETFSKETLVLIHYQIHEIDEIKKYRVSTLEPASWMVMFAVTY